MSFSVDFDIQNRINYEARHIFDCLISTESDLKNIKKLGCIPNISEWIVNRIYMHIYIHVCVWVRVCVRLCVFLWVCMWYIYIYIYIYIYVCVCVCVCVWAYWVIKWILRTNNQKWLCQFLAMKSAKHYSRFWSVCLKYWCHLLSLADFRARAPKIVR